MTIFELKLKKKIINQIKNEIFLNFQIEYVKNKNWLIFELNFSYFYRLYGIMRIIDLPEFSTKSIKFPARILLGNFSAQLFVIAVNSFLWHWRDLCQKFEYDSTIESLMIHITFHPLTRDWAISSLPGKFHQFNYII